MQLTHIFLYPIKSTLGYEVRQAVVQLQGLNFDRQFMLAEPTGTFITARKDGTLYNFSAYPMPFGLFVEHKDGDQIMIRYEDFAQGELKSCEVWGTHFPAFTAAEEINRWFSEKIGRAVQLRWTGEHSQRRIKNHPHKPVSFADGFPLLLTSTASLDDVQKHCPIPLTMSRFRPNIVVDGETAFAEQQWKEIKIGDVTFLNDKLCARCVLTTRDPATGETDIAMEPFRTLKKINADENGKPIFGINLIPLNSGVIRVGDTVNVLSYR